MAPRRQSETAANPAWQRPPAEVAYADELQSLRKVDTDLRPPGWSLSLRAIKRFIIGGANVKIDSVPRLRAELERRPPDLIRPRNRVADVHVFDVETVLGQAFVPGTQLWQAGRNVAPRRRLSAPRAPLRCWRTVGLAGAVRGRRRRESSSDADCGHGSRRRRCNRVRTVVSVY
jgi:hypothetical protein